MSGVKHVLVHVGLSDAPAEIAVVDLGPKLALVLAEGDFVQEDRIVGDLDKLSEAFVLEKL